MAAAPTNTKLSTYITASLIAPPQLETCLGFFETIDVEKLKNTNPRISQLAQILTLERLASYSVL
jgi:hypothetical protein